MCQWKTQCQMHLVHSITTSLIEQSISSITTEPKQASIVELPCLCFQTFRHTPCGWAVAVHERLSSVDWAFYCSMLASTGVLCSTNFNPLFPSFLTHTQWNVPLTLYLPRLELHKKLLSSAKSTLLKKQLIFVPLKIGPKKCPRLPIVVFVNCWSPLGLKQLHI